jgi:pimeloyl-ACP methyl ester carboxylesterase
MYLTAAKLNPSYVDLFGRGYSDAPSDLPYDARLYVTQILLVLASSELSWSQFHLVGYSLGGCLSVAFARYFPHRLRSLASIAGGGLIRRHHVGWRSRLLYDSGLLPEWLVRRIVRRRIRPAASTAAEPEPEPASGGSDIVAAESHVSPGDGDVNGGKGFDRASVSRSRPGVTVSSIVAWQIDRHDGFITAFLSTIRNAPIYAPQTDWEALSLILAERRKLGGDNDNESMPRGMTQGKVLLILGSDDPVVVADETIEDAQEVLGEDGVESVVLGGGHELPITMAADVASALETFWWH